MGKQTSPEATLGRLLACHEDGNRRCAMAHWHKVTGALLGSCIKCRHCQEWIRPEAMRERCPKRQEQS
jgi:hypothetical protein